MKISLELKNELFEEPELDTEEERQDASFYNEWLMPVIMSGRAASPGVAIGRAVIVNDMDDIVSIQEGSVMVSRTASPELAMGMSKACALATEFGGQGAAASGFAREIGIPAVVGVEGLVESIRDGDLVQIDGTNGIVEIMLRAVRSRVQAGKENV